jgi:hypothetical protein
MSDVDVKSLPVSSSMPSASVLPSSDPAVDGNVPRSIQASDLDPANAEPKQAGPAEKQAVDSDRDLESMKKEALSSMRSRCDSATNTGTNSSPNGPPKAIPISPSRSQQQDRKPASVSPRERRSKYSDVAGEIIAVLREQPRQMTNVSQLGLHYQAKFGKKLQLFGFEKLTHFLRSLSKYGIDFTDDMREVRVSNVRDAIARECKRWQTRPFHHPQSDHGASSNSLHFDQGKPDSGRSKVHCIYFNRESGCLNSRCTFLHCCKKCSSPAHGETRCRLPSSAGSGPLPTK